MGKLVVTLDWPYTNIPWIWVSSLLASDVVKEPNFEVIRGVSTDTNCTVNMLIRTALERGATEILAVAADQSFPKDILSRMRAHNKDIVSALTPSRQPGHPWLAFNLDKYGRGKQAELKTPLQRVDVVGGGCVLMKAEIFNKMPPPWVKATVTRDGCSVIQTADFYFFKKCREYGIEVYIDNTLESYHQTEVILNAKTLGRPLPFLEIVANNESVPLTATEQDKLDARLGRYEEEEGKLVYVDP